jgi:predicted methyltransferase
MIPKDPRSFIDDSLLDDYDKSVRTIAIRRVIRHLWTNSPCRISDLRDGVSVSVNAIAAVFIMLSREGVLTHTDGQISLTDFGRRWVLTHRTKIFMSSARIRYIEPVEPIFRSGKTASGQLRKSNRL